MKVGSIKAPPTDSIDAGMTAGIVGIVAVGLFMWASYGLFGLFANIALVVNMALIFAALSTIGGTLTLPGIGGIVLTIGMAVDANVLVYERIREELRIARSPARAIELGYQNALSAIIDANLTTLITAGALFFFGAGPVRGFAIVLGIGIVSSVFTAIYVTRFLIEVWHNTRQPKTMKGGVTCRMNGSGFQMKPRAGTIMPSSAPVAPACGKTW